MESWGKQKTISYFRFIMVASVDFDDRSVVIHTMSRAAQLSKKKWQSIITLSYEVSSK